MEITDLERYYNLLEEKKNSQNVSFLLNNDRAHNAIIEKFMLNNSNHIRMYCGEMSVFRENFYEYINRENGIELADYAKAEVRNALHEFVNRPDTSLEIYFETFNETYLRDIIDDEIFRKGLKLKKICLYKLDDKLFLKGGIAHISITDSNIIRIESNPVTHEAICSVNATPDIINNVNTTFSYMQSVREDILN